MAAPTYRSEAHSDSFGDLTINKPSGTVENDVLVAAIVTADGTITPPSGWSLITSRLRSSLRLVTYYKVAGASEPTSYTWTGTSNCLGGIVCYSGAHTSSPINASADADSGGTAYPWETDHYAPSITTTVADCALIAGVGVPADNSFTPPAGFTERIDDSSSPVQGGYTVATGEQAAAGASGTKLFVSSSAEASATFHIALAPPAAGGNAYLLENGTDRYLLEDGTGVLLLDVPLELNAEPGAYTVTGSAAGTLAGRMIAALAGSYALTGAATTLSRGFSLNAGPGAYNLSGLDAALSRGFNLNAGPGAYALSGSEAGLLATRLLSANAGTYGLTGFAGTLVAGRLLSANPGSYALAGAVAELLAGRVLSSDPGAYSITGALAGLNRGFNLNAEPGVYALTGFAAELLLAISGYSLNAEPGSYALTGADVALLADRVFVAEPGAYLVTGQTAALLAGRLLPADPGAYQVEGAGATLSRGLVFVAESGTYLVTGATAEFMLAHILSADPGAYLITGAETRALLDLEQFPATTGGTKRTRQYD